MELNLRSVLDSTFAKDEGVRVSISPGFWLYPFKEFPMGFGLASQWAVSEEKNFFSNVLFAIKYPL